MWRFVSVVAALAVSTGCYAPSVTSGVDCAGGGACPKGFACAADTLTCQPAGHEAPPDAVIDAVDALPDGPPCMPAPPGTRSFVFSGEIEAFVIPTCSPIRIDAWGAQGGAGQGGGKVGGKGAHVAATFALPVGETITILVGGKGLAGSDPTGQRGGSGGGGTFVVTGADTSLVTPLVVAGGGGGGVGGMFTTADGGPGQDGPDGQAGTGNPDAVGGTMGSGGVTWQITNPQAGNFQQATAGGGLFGDGSGASNGGANFGTPNGPGQAFVHGGAGGKGGSQGRDGGFGGGGAAGFTGGGGGGYSGGAASGGMVTTYAGGGGGSIATGLQMVTEAGINAGDGRVTITW